MHGPETGDEKLRHVLGDPDDENSAAHGVSAKIQQTCAEGYIKATDPKAPCIGCAACGIKNLNMGNEGAENCRYYQHTLTDDKVGIARDT